VFAGIPDTVATDVVGGLVAPETPWQDAAETGIPKRWQLLFVADTRLHQHFRVWTAPSDSTTSDEAFGVIFSLVEDLDTVRAGWRPKRSRLTRGMCSETFRFVRVPVGLGVRNRKPPIHVFDRRGTHTSGRSTLPAALSMIRPLRSRQNVRYHPTEPRRPPGWPTSGWGSGLPAGTNSGPPTAPIVGGTLNPASLDVRR